MAKADYRINFLNRKLFYKYGNLAFLILISLFVSECRFKSDIKEVTYLKDDNRVCQNWEEVFKDETIIKFNFPNPEQELLSITSMTINSNNGDYFILDGRDKKVVQFSSECEFIRFIGNEGEGPGEFSLPICPCIDIEGNFYLFDIGKRRINKYLYPDYQYAGQIQLRASIQDAILDNRNNFITYSFYSDFILKKYNFEGKIIKKKYKPEDRTLKLFMARFQLGRIDEVPGEGFLFIYPDKYVIYFFDYELNLKREFRSRSTSRFYPEASRFPSDLSPYDFNPSHSEWWDSFLHPALIYCFKDGYFVVVVYESRKLGGRDYVNLHDMNGITYAKGLEVPFHGIVRYTKGDYIYVVEEAKVGDGDEILPTKLHRYRMKQNIR